MGERSEDLDFQIRFRGGTDRGGGRGTGAPLRGPDNGALVGVRNGRRPVHGRGEERGVRWRRATDDDIENAADKRSDAEQEDQACRWQEPISSR